MFADCLQTHIASQQGKRVTGICFIITRLCIRAGNTNTLAGNVPPKADLGDLRGLASGIDGRIAPMINGGDFDGAKAYKDSKVRGVIEAIPAVLVQVAGF